MIQIMLVIPLLLTNLAFTPPVAVTRNKCLLCHSVEGVGNKAGPLDGIGARQTPKELREALVNPVPSKTRPKLVMKSYKDSPDLNALVKFLQELK